MTDLLGVGVIGCGNISGAYLQLGPLFNGIEMRACADLDMAVAEARAAEHGVRANSVQDLLASDDIDIVVNLTVPDAHVAVTTQILEAGKHAYSEKPLSLTVEDGRKMKALADRSGLRVGCAPDTFLGGAHQLARRHLDDGGVGAIVTGTCHVMGHGHENWHPNPDFFYRVGGGPLLDMGPYYLANLINLLGPVRRVAAMTTMSAPTRTITSEPRAGEVIPVETPTTIHGVLEFAAGRQITLSASWDVWAHRHDHMELYGVDGALFLPDPNAFGGEVRAAGRDGRIGPLPAWDHPLGRNNMGEGDRARANYRTAGLADMAQAIVAGRDHRCSIDRTLHAVDVMTALLASGESGAFIELATTCTRPDPLGPDEARALMKA